MSKMKLTIRHFSILFIFSLPIFLNAQSRILKSQSSLETLGLSININKTSLPKSSYENGLGAGFSLMTDVNVLNKTDLRTGLGLNLYNLKNTDSSFSQSIVNLELTLGVKQHIKALDNSSIIFSVTPSQALFSDVRYSVPQQNATPTSSIIPQLSSGFSLGTYLGFEFDFKERSAMEFGYQHILNQDLSNGYVDAAPHNFKFTYTFNFLGKSRRGSQFAAARATIKSLKNDTLYFINATCEGDATDEQLDSILNENFTYCPYKVLSKESLEENKIKAIHFAVIGRYFSSEGDPETVGIYLLDSTRRNCEFPYPYYTAALLNGAVNPLCHNTHQAIAFNIRLFNSRLPR